MTAAPPSDRLRDSPATRGANRERNCSSGSPSTRKRYSISPAPAVSPAGPGPSTQQSHNEELSALHSESAEVQWMYRWNLEGMRVWSVMPEHQGQSSRPSVAMPLGVHEVVDSGHRRICAALGNRLLVKCLRTRRAEPQEYSERGHGDTQVIELSNYRED